MRYIVKPKPSYMYINGLQAIYIDVEDDYRLSL